MKATADNLGLVVGFGLTWPLRHACRRGVFLPIGDTPNPPGFKAYVNWSLIAANVAIFALVSWPLMNQAAGAGSPGYGDYLHVLGQPPRSLYDLFVFQNGYKPGAPQLSDLFSSMFLHGGFAHLAGNMLFLWIYGDNVEHYLGRVRYLLSYIGSGIAATLVFSMFSGGSLIPLVGASGAISGVLGFYFLLFPRNQVKVFIFLFPFILNVFLIPARVVLGIYLILDNLFPFLLGVGGSVAHGAHIGGFIAGLGLAWVKERRGSRWTSKTDRAGRAAPVSGVNFRPVGNPTGLLRDALEAGRKNDAVDIAMQVGPRGLKNLPVGETVQLAGYLNDKGNRAAANHLLRQAIPLHQTDRHSLATLYLALGLLRLNGKQPTSAYQYLLQVLDLAPGSSLAQRAQQALDTIPVYRQS